MTITRVLGIDVSKRSVSTCLLEQKPSDIRQFYYKYAFQCFNADASGIKGILSLNPDVAIIEPTGTNYSKLWVKILGENGVTIKFVDHSKLRKYREFHLELPDKDDNADALALACYYFDYSSPSRYLTVRDATTSQLRELILRLNHLNRVQSPIINRLRQDLAWQFPEIALTQSNRSRSGDIPLLWGWLAGERNSKKYDLKYMDSVGLGINNTVKKHAARLCDLYREEYEIEDRIKDFLQLPKYIPYIKAFDDFGFGARTQALILSQIYPLSNFLNDDGTPIVEFHQSRNNPSKQSKRRLSERRFQKILGLAPTQESSGDKKKTKVLGSKLCRKAFWLWVFTCVEPVKSRTNKITQNLGVIMDKEKTGGRPVQKVRSRICVKACKLLFNQLVKNLMEYNYLVE